MNYETLLNPFNRIAGAKALAWGLGIMVLTTIVCYFSHCHLDGALDAHVGIPTDFWRYAAEGLTDWLVLALSLYAAGCLVSSAQIRLIDILGTTALARGPMLLVAFAAFIPVVPPDAQHQVTAGLIFLGLLFMALSIWMILLLFHAYSVSCNLKGKKAVLSFMIAVVCAEAVSKLIIYYFF